MVLIIRLYENNKNKNGNDNDDNNSRKISNDNIEYKWKPRARRPVQPGAPFPRRSAERRRAAESLPPWSSPLAASETWRRVELTAAATRATPSQPGQAPPPFPARLWPPIVGHLTPPSDPLARSLVWASWGTAVPEATAGWGIVSCVSGSASEAQGGKGVRCRAVYLFLLWFLFYHSCICISSFVLKKSRFFLPIFWYRSLRRFKKCRRGSASSEGEGGAFPPAGVRPSGVPWDPRRSHQGIAGCVGSAIGAPAVLTFPNYCLFVSHFIQGDGEIFLISWWIRRHVFFSASRCQFTCKAIKLTNLRRK